MLRIWMNNLYRRESVRLLAHPSVSHALYNDSLACSFKFRAYSHDIHHQQAKSSQKSDFAPPNPVVLTSLVKESSSSHNNHDNTSSSSSSFGLRTPTVLSPDMTKRPFEITVEKGRSKALTKISFNSKAFTYDDLKAAIAQLENIRIKDMDVQAALDLVSQTAMRDITLSSYPRIMNAVVATLSSSDIMLSRRQLGELGMGMRVVNGQSSTDIKFLVMVHCILTQKRYQDINNETLCRLIYGLKSLPSGVRAVNDLLDAISSIFESSASTYTFSSYQLHFLLGGLRNMVCTSHAEYRLAHHIIAALEKSPAPAKLNATYLTSMFFSIRYLTNTGYHGDHTDKILMILNRWLQEAKEVMLNESCIGVMALGVRMFHKPSSARASLHAHLTRIIQHHITQYHHDDYIDRKHHHKDHHRIVLTEASFSRISQLLFYLNRHTSKEEAAFIDVLMNLILYHQHPQLRITRDMAIGDLIFSLRGLGHHLDDVLNSPYTEPLLSSVMKLWSSSSISSIPSASISCVFGGIKYLPISSSSVQALLSMILPKLQASSSVSLSLKQTGLVIGSLEHFTGYHSIERELMTAIYPMLQRTYDEMTKNQYEMSGLATMKICVGVKYMDVSHDICRRLMTLAAALIMPTSSDARRVKRVRTKYQHTLNPFEVKTLRDVQDYLRLRMATDASSSVVRGQQEEMAVLNMLIDAIDARLATHISATIP